MKTTLKLTAAASAFLLAGTISASAALVDFTIGKPGTLSGTEAGGWSVTGNLTPNANFAGPGAIGTPTLAGDNDGFGVRDDEITYPRQYVTVTFNKAVTLTGAYFLDLFITSSNTAIKEIANIARGTGIAAAEAQLEATANTAVAGKENKFGYGSLTGMSLKGTTFSFFASSTNDGQGQPDFALAGLTVAPIPLPAGAILFGTALGGLGLMRRKRKS
jgi:hypothetical protein